MGGMPSGPPAPVRLFCQGVAHMQFAVIVRSNESTNLPPIVALGLVKQTMQMLAANKEPRIKAQYPFAGERAGIFIVDVNSGDELQELISSLPFSGLVKAEIHAIGSNQASLKTIEEAERRVAAMTPAGAR
jgi:muconolactone delta-isomerase